MDKIWYEILQSRRSLAVVAGMKKIREKISVCVSVEFLLYLL